MHHSWANWGGYFFNSRIGSCLPHLIFILARNISDSLIIITHIPATYKYLKICLNLRYMYFDFSQSVYNNNTLALMTPYFMAFFHYIIILKQVRVRIIYSTVAENIWKMSFIGVVYNKKLTDYKIASWESWKNWWWHIFVFRLKKYKW